jgi:hypothetical protein
MNEWWASLVWWGVGVEITWEELSRTQRERSHESQEHGCDLEAAGCHGGFQANSHKIRLKRSGEFVESVTRGRSCLRKHWLQSCHWPFALRCKCEIHTKVKRLLIRKQCIMLHKTSMIHLRHIEINNYLIRYHPF